MTDGYSAEDGDPGRDLPETRDRPRVHVLYEYGADYRPHASAHLRLIRPLSHPSVAGAVDATFGMALDGRCPDAVVVDRLWRPDITADRAWGLVREIARSGARFVYALDDNLLDLPGERSDWPERRHLETVELFLGEADVVLVASAALAERVAPLCRRVLVLPHALDERLLARTYPPSRESPFGLRPVTIGYMGTSTHADDLAMIAPALKAVCERHAGRVRLELIGVAEVDEARQLLGETPVRIVTPGPAEREYPLFLLWFTANMRWDIAVSPLRNTPFRRCKSDIKFLDYCAIGAAGVYSRTPAYEATVRTGESGWLASDEPGGWEEALERLVCDDALRESVAHGGARQLYRERTLRRCAPTWVEAIDAVCGGPRAAPTMATSPRNSGHREEGS